MRMTNEVAASAAGGGISVAIFVGVSWLIISFSLVNGVDASTSTENENWETAHATFYGDMTANECRMGACGYDTFTEGYGTDTAALSTALFDDGATCGSCYEIRCFDDPQWCNNDTIAVTATNYCPPDPSKPSDNGGWCNPPRPHFDLTLPVFLRIAESKAGIVPVQYRRVPCVKSGGIAFEMRADGNPNWVAVLIYNVAGAGDVTGLSVLGSKSGEWVTMSRNWGQVWQTSAELLGQGLSFQVTASDGRMVQADNVVPPDWNFGQSFKGTAQF